MEREHGAALRSRLWRMVFLHISNSLREARQEEVDFDFAVTWEVARHARDGRLWRTWRA